MKKYAIPVLLSLSLLSAPALQGQQPERDLIPPGGQTQKVPYKRVPVKVTHSYLPGKPSATPPATQQLAMAPNSYPAGHTPGKLDVSRGGAAVYSIPLKLPPGIKGVAPKLGLSYNSQAGDGIAGYGWNLAGISSIRRVAATPIRDGFKGSIHFDSNDRFALDGQRLLLKSGTSGEAGAVYQTENQSNLKIKSLNDHQFLVTYPNGSRAWYRSTSRYHLSYPIERWEDAQGNFITYTYAESNRVMHISEIQYGSNGGDAPTDQIKFTYRSRSRPETSYTHGIPFINSYLLDSIAVYGKDNLLRKYALGYDHPGSTRDSRLGYDRLTSVQEFNGAGQALEPNNFSYPSAGTGMSKTVCKSRLTPRFINEVDRMVVGDYDGNGKTDVLYYDQGLYSDYRDGKLNILLGAGDKSVSSAYQINLGNFDYASASTILSTNNHVLDRQAISVVFEDYRQSEDSNLKVKNYTMAAYGPAFYYQKTISVPSKIESYCGTGRYVDYTYHKIPKDYVSGDFDGDGLTDLLAVTKPYASNRCYKKIIPPGQPRFIDDDCECYTLHYDYSELGLINLNPNVETSKSYNRLDIQLKAVHDDGKDRLYAVDFDGDGKTDLLQIADQQFYVYGFNRDNSRFVLKYSKDYDSYLYSDHPVLLGDYNGDGKTDFMTPRVSGSSDWVVYQATGVGYSRYITSISMYDRHAVISYQRYVDGRWRDYVDQRFKYFTQDINGDGKADFVETCFDMGVLKVKFYNNFADSYGKPQFHSDRDTFIYLGYYAVGGTPVFWDASKANGRLPEFGYLNESSYTSLRLDQNFKQSTQLTNINEGGQLSKDIHYEEIDNQQTSPLIYSTDYSAHYPYRNINIAPDFRVVSQITQSDGSHLRTRKFIYRGAVSHLQGLGFLGFKSMSRSNFYGRGGEGLASWTTRLYDPQLRGSLRSVITSDSHAFIGEYVPGDMHTDYTYHSQLRSDKVWIDQLTQTKTQDNLKGTTTTQTFTYDPYGNPLTINTDYNGQGSKRQVFTYDNNPNGTGKDYYMGRVKQQTQTTTMGGDAFTTSQAYTYESGSPELLASMVKKGNGGDQSLQEHYTYDRFGNPIQKTLSGDGISPRTTKTTYDASGRFVRTQTDVLGLTTTFTHDPATGLLLKKTDPFGLSTAYAYDSWQRLKQKTDYLGHSTTYDYSRDGRSTVVAQHNPVAPDTKTWYDAFGEKTKSSRQAPLGSKWIAASWTYDDIGELIKKSQPYYEGSSPTQWDQFEYDDYGRLTQHELYTGKTIKTTYDGLTTTVEDGTRTKQTTEDGMGNTVKVTDPGGTIDYTYYGNGKLKTADYGDYSIQQTIDQWGRKRTLTDPSAGAYTYQYNILGALLKQTTPKGETTYTYDAYGRKLTKKVKGDLSDMQISYQYDPKTKRLEQISGSNQADGSGTYTYTYDYDQYNRVTAKTEENSKARFIERYTYDDYGRKASEQTQALDNVTGNESQATVGYAYASGSGALVEIKDTKSGQSLWKRDSTNARGQTTAFTYGNGIGAKCSYDGYGFPSRISQAKDSTVALDETYTFDPKRSNLLSREDVSWGSGAVERFDYDKLDRLTDINGNMTQSQSYDTRGSITQNAALGHYNYASGNRYQLAKIALNDSGKAYYKTHTLQQIRYNASMAPVDIYEKGHGRLSFDYNILESRSHAYYGSLDTSKALRPYQKHYSADGRMEILEDKKKGETRFITYLDGSAYNSRVIWMTRYQGKAQKLAAPYYLHRDYLGSIRAISDSAGAVVERRHFDPWGVLDRYSGSNGKDTSAGFALLDRGYSGHEHFFGVGLVHMNSRMYDPLLHRFLSPDNYVQAPLNTQDFNRYGYVLNNPLKYKDPSGDFFIVDSWIFGFFHGLFHGGLKEAWHDANHRAGNDAKIWGGLFTTDPNKSFWGRVGEVLSRFTKQLPQTLVGLLSSQTTNTLGLAGGVQWVKYKYGATVLKTRKVWGAFTLGSYIIGDNNIEADPNNRFFQHEYGHYLQSQEMGFAYLSRVAIPSVLHCDEQHEFYPFEQDANRRAFLYLNKNVAGFKDDFRKDDYKGWDFVDNPLDVDGLHTPGQYVDYENPDAVRSLNRLTLRAKWYDYASWAFGVTGAVIDGINNSIGYNH